MSAIRSAHCGDRMAGKQSNEKEGRCLARIHHPRSPSSGRRSHRVRWSTILQERRRSVSPASWRVRSPRERCDRWAFTGAGARSRSPGRSCCAPRSADWRPCSRSRPPRRRCAGAAGTSKTDAGLDLAAHAARRIDPAGLLRTSAGALARMRRRRRGPDAWFRGEELILGRGERGALVSVPFGGSHGGSHTLVVGATGSGKTVTQTRIAVRAIERGHGRGRDRPEGRPRPARARSRARPRRRAGRSSSGRRDGPSVYNPFAQRQRDRDRRQGCSPASASASPTTCARRSATSGMPCARCAAPASRSACRPSSSISIRSGWSCSCASLSPPDARATHAYLDSLSTRQQRRSRRRARPARDPRRVRRRALARPARRTARAGSTCAARSRARAVVYFDARRRQPAAARADARRGDRAGPADDRRGAAGRRRADARRHRRVLGRRRRAGRAPVRPRALGRESACVLGTQELADLRLPGQRAAARAGAGQPLRAGRPSPGRAGLGRADRRARGQRGRMAHEHRSQPAMRTTRTRAQEPCSRRAGHAPRAPAGRP